MTVHSATLSPFNPLALRWQRASAGPLRHPVRYLFPWPGGRAEAFAGHPPAGPIEVERVVDGVDLAALPRFAVTVVTATGAGELAGAVAGRLGFGALTVAVRNRSTEVVGIGDSDVPPGGDAVANGPADPAVRTALIEVLLTRDGLSGWLFGAVPAELDSFADVLRALRDDDLVDYLEFAGLVGQCGVVGRVARVGGRPVVTLFGTDPQPVGFGVQPAAMPGAGTALRTEVWTDDRVPAAELVTSSELDLTGTGVTVIDDLRGNSAVQRLFMDGCRLLDTSPLATMTGLRVLSVRGVKLDSLNTLADLPALRSLTFDRRPFAGLEALSELRSLRELDVTGLPLVSPAELGGASGLTDLAWSTPTRESVTVDGLSGLTQLERLSLRVRGMVDVAPLAGLRRLVSLDLVGSGVTDPSPLTALPTLTQLSLAATPFSDWTTLSGLTEVRRLSLANSHLATLGDLVMPSVVDLDLSHTRVTDLAVLRSWPQLRRVDITGTDADPGLLAGSAVSTMIRLP